MELIFGFVVGTGLMVAGWSAWTGRWRAWAHPFSGWGCTPPLSLPLGLTLVCASIFSREDQVPLWAAPFLLCFSVLGVVALLLFLVNVFHDFKRFPLFLRPPWLPANAPVPIFWNPPGFMAGWQAANTRWALVTREEKGVGRQLAYWDVWYVEESPLLPGLALDFYGFRSSRLDVYEEGVALYVQYIQDRDHSGTFTRGFRPGDVEKIEFVPAPRFSWRSLLEPRTHVHYPRVFLHTDERTHHIAVLDRKFRRDAGRGLDLLAGTLRAPVELG
jgi:hypothetical protein